jgi:hypothetical protein
VKGFDLGGDARLGYLAELVHEADLKDEKFAHAETRGLVFVLTALRQTIESYTGDEPCRWTGRSC